MKYKSALCFVLCLCIMLCIFPCYISSDAANQVILPVINNTVLRPLTNDIMPVIIDGAVYVPFDMLAFLEGVTLYYNDRLQQIYVYDSLNLIVFDLSNDRTYDANGTLYDKTAKSIGGKFYLPAETICEKLGIYCSLTDYTGIAPMFRINQGELIASDLDFSTMLEYLLRTTYNTYMSSGQYDIPIIPDEPVPPAPVKKLGYMTFLGISESVLLQIDTPSTFFLDDDEISSSGSLIRRAVSHGHDIGIVLDANSELSLLQQFERANALLQLQSCYSARLVTVYGGSAGADSAAISELIGHGARLWDSNVTLNSNNDSIDGLIRQTDALDLAAVIFIPCAGKISGNIPLLLSELTDNNITPIDIRIWTTPINQANDIR